MVKEYSKSKVCYNELIDFFTRIDCQFDPPFSTRIRDRSTVCSIDDYLKKVLSLGNLLIYSSGCSPIEGIVVLYANDTFNRAAYIPMLAIDEKYRGKGIATKLVLAAIELSKRKEMKTIAVKTWVSNGAARKVYTKAGFVEKNISDTEILFEKRL